MRKVLLFASVLALIIGGLAVTASAGNDELAVCKAAGIPTDICATCDVADHEAGGSFAACDCKRFLAEDPADFAALYENLGACISAHHN